MEAYKPYEIADEIVVLSLCICNKELRITFDM